MDESVDIYPLALAAFLAAVLVVPLKQRPIIIIIIKLSPYGWTHNKRANGFFQYFDGTVRSLLEANHS